MASPPDPAPPSPDDGGELTEDERAALRALAEKLARQRLGMPALLFLESMAPLRFLASQAMYALAPLVSLVGAERGWTFYARLLEKRGSMEALIAAIDAAERAR